MRQKENDGKCPFCGFDSNEYAASPHHLPLKTILAGKYLIGRVLGEGGFGITYLAWDLNLGVKIAVKEYYPMGFVTREHNSTCSVLPYVGDKTAFFAAGRDRYVEEAKSLAKFYGLPGIVAVKDFFLENNTAYIVMEFVEGKTLKQMLADEGGKLPAATVLEMMKPLIRSLSEVHNAGVIHRDISPDNIMVTKEGNVKLLDFGAARDYADSGNRSLSVLLKPGYAPEEQYRTRGVQGPWSDVYALCATIYRAITGVTPPESVERLRADELKAPSSLGAALEPAREKALLKGMAVLQNDRWQSVIELYEALYAEQYVAGAPLAPPRKKAPVTPKKAAPQPKTARQPASSAGKTRKWGTPKWVALGVASLVLVSAAVFFVRAAATGDYDENSLVGKILSNAGSAEHKKGSDGDGGSNIALLNDAEKVSPTASSAATSAPGKATPTTATPTATPTNTPKKEEGSKQTSAPGVTATPKQAATQAPATAVPTTNPTASPTAAPTPTKTPKPTATPTPKPTVTPNTATSWSDWVTKLPGGVSSPTYSIESKNQYRTVYYTYTGLTTIYKYDYGDGTSSNWTMDSSLCGTYPYTTQETGLFSASYGSWIDGDAVAYRPEYDGPHDLEGVETRTVYRYKHN